MPQKPDPLAAFGTPVGQEQSTGPDPLAAFGDPVKKAEPSPQDPKPQMLNLPFTTGNIPIPLPPAVANALNRAKEFITPTPRSASRMVGAAIGGTTGIPMGPAGIAAGGGLGAVGADALYQMYNASQGNQGQIDPSQITDAMIQGGLQEGAGPALTGVATRGMQKGIISTIGNVTKPASEAEKMAVRKIASEVAGEFPVAGSSPKLLEKYTEKLNTAGRELDAAYQGVPKNLRIRSGPMKAAVQAQRQKLVIQGSIPPGSEPQAKAFDEVIQWFDQHPSFTLDELRQNKALFDRVVNWYRGSLSAEPAKEQAYMAGANQIREQIGNIFPSIAEKNAKVHAWKTLTDSLGRADVKTFGKAANLLPDAVRGGMGALVGYAAGGPEGAAIGGVGMAAANELLQSTAFQTASIPMRNAAIKLLQNGNVQGAIHLLNAAGAGGALKGNERVPISINP